VKRILLYFLLPLIGLMACETSEDSVFDRSSDERLNAALATYQKRLVDAPHGWKAVLKPGGGGVYSFYFKFNDQNRVVMYSDFTQNSANVSKESSYRLKALQTPALLFDTYSYIHVLADPDDEVNGGTLGEGLKSDFEFGFNTDSVNAEQIRLVGRMNKSELLLTEATSEEAAAYAAGNLAKSQQFENLANYQKYFKRVTINGIEYEVKFNGASRLITFSWLEGSELKSFSSNYYYSINGVVFIHPFVSGSVAIYSLDNVAWDASKEQVSFSVDGVRSTILSADRPLKIDTGAPRAWWQASQEEDTYWESRQGFHVNGVEDGLGMRQMRTDSSRFYSFFYWPNYNSSYDAFGPLLLGGRGLELPYGFAPRRPTFTSDGRAIFTNYGTLGPVPTSGPVVEAARIMYNTSGFYFIKTSDTTYDMISASDSGIWITWTL
jgi:hypothetical protein